MAKNRMINTRFWDDDYTSNLDPIEKLMFLYLLTNTSTNISGIYEIPTKKIALETGIDKEMVLKIIDRFTNDEKVFYADGWICIKNFIKHQNQKSMTVQKGIENELMAVPKDIMDKFIGYGYGMHTLSYLTQPNLIKSNSTQEGEKPAQKAPTPSQLASEFFERGGAYQVCIEALAKSAPREYVVKELDKFIDYWTEPNKSGTKVRWQQQSTFEIKRRLTTWLNRVKDDYKKSTTKPNVVFS